MSFGLWFVKLECNNNNLTLSQHSKENMYKDFFQRLSSLRTRSNSLTKMVIKHRVRMKGEFEHEKSRGRLQVFNDRLHQDFSICEDLCF